MSASIYPPVTSDLELKMIINNNLNSERARKIIDKIKHLQNQYDHYKKVQKRWKVCSKIVRVLNLTIAGSIAAAVGVLAIITTQGIAVPPLLIAILGGYSAIETSVMEGMNIGIIKKKKHKFSGKCQIIQDSINKLYFYYEKARQDGIITIEELEGFEKIYKQFDRSINKVISKENENKFDMDAIRKEAEDEAKHELATELKEKLKNEAKQKLRSTVVS
jgi:flagellar motor component MotA